MKNRVLLVFLALVLVVSLAAFGACAPAEEFTLKITAIGEGTTSPAPGTSTVTEGESVTVTAIPNTGYELGYWEGDVSGTDDSVTFKMTSDKSVVAVFVEEEEVWEWPKSITATAMGIGSSEYVRYLAWATEFEQDTGCHLRIFPAENTQLRYEYVKNGQSTLASSGWAEWIEPITGYGSFATRLGGPFPIRATITSTELPFIAYTTADSPIQSYKDITTETRIATCPYLGLVERIARDILPAAAGIDPEEANIIAFGSYGAEALSVIEGTADIAVSVPASSYTQQVAASPKGIRIIDLNFSDDPEAAARVSAVNPNYVFGPATEGVEESIGKYGLLVVGFYHTRAETDPDLVYHWMKWMFDNYDLYKDKAVGFEYTTVERTLYNIVRDPEPLHDGAVRYYTELGLWTDAMDRQNELKKEIIQQYVDAYEAAIEEADANQITIDPENEEWVELWQSYLEQLPPIEVPPLE